MIRKGAGDYLRLVPPQSGRGPTRSMAGAGRWNRLAKAAISRPAADLLIAVFLVLLTFLAT